MNKKQQTSSVIPSSCYLKTNPHQVLTNRMFSELIGKPSFGHYQYHKGSFIYMSNAKAAPVSKISIEEFVMMAKKTIGSFRNVKVNLKQEGFLFIACVNDIDGVLLYTSRGSQNYIEPFIHVYDYEKRIALEAITKG